MAKFRVVAGKHHQRQEDGTEKTFIAGDEIELTAAEAASFPNKFIPVVEEPEPVTKEPAAVAATRSAIQPGRPQVQPRLSPK